MKPCCYGCGNRNTVAQDTNGFRWCYGCAAEEEGYSAVYWDVNFPETGGTSE